MANADDVPGDAGDVNGSDRSGIAIDLKSIISSENHDIAHDLEGPKSALTLLHFAACAAVSLPKLLF